MSQGKIYNLITTNKARISLTPAPPNEVFPTNTVVLFPSGGRLMPSSGDLHFYQTTMAELAAFLTHSYIRPIVDATNLAGAFDFTLPRLVPLSEVDHADPEGLVQYRIEDLGLALKSGTGPIITLVIDHIEKPSPN